MNMKMYENIFTFHKKKIVRELWWQPRQLSNEHEQCAARVDVFYLLLNNERSHISYIDVDCRLKCLHFIGDHQRSLAWLGLAGFVLKITTIRDKVVCSITLFISSNACNYVDFVVIWNNIISDSVNTDAWIKLCESEILLPQ